MTDYKLYKLIDNFLFENLYEKDSDILNEKLSEIFIKNDYHFDCFWIYWNYGGNAEVHLDGNNWNFTYNLWKDELYEFHFFCHKKEKIKSDNKNKKGIPGMVVKVEGNDNLFVFLGVNLYKKKDTYLGIDYYGNKNVNTIEFKLEDTVEFYANPTIYRFRWYYILKNLLLKALGLKLDGRLQIAGLTHKR